jgi:hypothetical protein
MVARGADSGSLSCVSSVHLLLDLLRGRVLDAELAALLWLLLDARTPLVVVGADPVACDLVVGGVRGLLPETARLMEVAPDDDFEWLPEAAELGWRRDRRESVDRATWTQTAAMLTAADGVLLVRGLGAPGGVGGARARIVVRALTLGYGMLATMAGEGLEDALNTLHAPEIGTDPDERSRLGVVLAMGDAGGSRVTAAHYVRPVALDTHGHVQRPAPAILATWNVGAARWDHFAWGVLPDIAGRLGIATIELEREQALRAAALSDVTPGA